MWLSPSRPCCCCSSPRDFPIVWVRRNCIGYHSWISQCPPHLNPHFSHLFHTRVSTLFSFFLSASFLVRVHLTFFFVGLRALRRFNVPTGAFFYLSSHAFIHDSIFLCDPTHRLAASSFHSPTISRLAVFNRLVILKVRHTITVCWYRVRRQKRRRAVAEYRARRTTRRPKTRSPWRTVT